jgi:hypothetical protein
MIGANSRTWLKPTTPIVLKSMVPLPASDRSAAATLCLQGLKNTRFARETGAALIAGEDGPAMADKVGNQESDIARRVSRGIEMDAERLRSRAQRVPHRGGEIAERVPGQVAIFDYAEGRAPRVETR